MSDASIFHEGNALKSASQTMQSVIRSIENINRTMDSIYSRSMPMWEGKSAIQHEKNYKELQIMLNDYLQTSTETKNALDLTISTYETTESDQQKAISQLDTGGIFTI